MPRSLTSSSRSPPFSCFSYSSNLSAMRSMLAVQGFMTCCLAIRVNNGGTRATQDSASFGSRCCWGSCETTFGNFTGSHISKFSCHPSHEVHDLPLMNMSRKDCPYYDNAHCPAPPSSPAMQEDAESEDTDATKKKGKIRKLVQKSLQNNPNDAHS